MFCFVGFLSAFLHYLDSLLDCVRACVNTLEMQNLCENVIYIYIYIFEFREENEFCFFSLFFF